MGIYQGSRVSERSSALPPRSPYGAGVQFGRNSHDSDWRLAICHWSLEPLLLRPERVTIPVAEALFFRSGFHIESPGHQQDFAADGPPVARAWPSVRLFR